MTQNEALAKAKELWPQWTETLQVEQTLRIGMPTLCMETFTVWRVESPFNHRIIATSHSSWEDAFAEVEVSQ